MLKALYCLLYHVCLFSFFLADAAYQDERSHKEAEEVLKHKNKELDGKIQTLISKIIPLFTMLRGITIN